MSLADDVTRYYAERAPVYDETAGYNDPEMEKLRHAVKARYRRMFRNRDVLEIACGTGYWTSVVGEVANSVLAIDINSAIVGIAEERCKQIPQVKFEIADAYTLEGIQTGFTGAFGIWWWSHMPKALIPRFLTSLHVRLQPGASVLFVDQLLGAYEPEERRISETGDIIEQRTLPNGQTFRIVKNFPTKSEIVDLLGDMAEDIFFREFPEECSWNLKYTMKK